MGTYLRTLKFRVKDKHKHTLNQWAFEVNQVWNNANAITSEYGYVPIPGIGYVSKFFSAFDLARYQTKHAKERDFDLHSQTIQEVTEHHAKARKQFKKTKLRWRCSSGSRKALGWVPFKKGNAKYKSGQIFYRGQYFKIWDTIGLSGFELRSGSFSEDSRGRWYFNVVVECQAEEHSAKSDIGVDLGLKDIATCSNGERLESKRFFRQLEEKLGKAQRAKKKRLVKTIHAKIRNSRKDHLHKFSNRLTKNNALIVVGNVSSFKLSKTNMAKSVLDAGWHMLKTQLKYKAIARSVEFLEVDEKYTTQSCSCCGCISHNSPKGRSGLGIREWVCSECGALHDRDINAARNILRLGHQSLAGGIPVL